MAAETDKPNKPSVLPYAGAGGCLLPVALYVFFALLGDVGGPLLWVFGVIPLFILGALLGSAVWSFRTKDRDTEPAAESPSKPTNHPGPTSDPEP
jgi:hypothetical protein